MFYCETLSICNFFSTFEINICLAWEYFVTFSSATNYQKGKQLVHGSLMRALHNHTTPYVVQSGNTVIKLDVSQKFDTCYFLCGRRHMYCHHYLHSTFHSAQVFHLSIIDLYFLVMKMKSCLHKFNDCQQMQLTFSLSYYCFQVQSEFQKAYDKGIPKSK